MARARVSQRGSSVASGLSAPRRAPAARTLAGTFDVKRLCALEHGRRVEPHERSRADLGHRYVELAHRLGDRGERLGRADRDQRRADELRSARAPTRVPHFEQTGTAAGSRVICRSSVPYLDACTWTLEPPDKCAGFAPQSADCNMATCG